MWVGPFCSAHCICKAYHSSSEYRNKGHTRSRIFNTVLGSYLGRWRQSSNKFCWFFRDLFVRCCIIRNSRGFKYETRKKNVNATALLNVLFICSARFEIQNPWQCLPADLGDVGVSESCLLCIIIKPLLQLPRFNQIKFKWPFILFLSNKVKVNTGK